MTKPVVQRPDAASALVTKLLRRHPLDRISLRVQVRGCSAVAMPAGFHPAVAERRDKALAAYAERSRDGSVSLEQATKANADALGPVATGYGATLLAALEQLEVELQSSPTYA